MTLAPWHMKSQPWMLVASKAIFLENYLAVSTWILNGSSIGYLKKKYQPFSLAGVRLEAYGESNFWVKICLAQEWTLTLLLCNCCYKQSLRNNPRNQTNIFRLNVTLTMPRSQSCIKKAFYRVRDLKFDRTSINECEIPDYHAHLLFYSFTVVFFATKSCIVEWIFFHGIKAGKFNSVFN